MKAHLNKTKQRSSFFPKELTTVTPLSKVIALILFITLPFGGFYLGTLYQENLSYISQESLQHPVFVKPIETEFIKDGYYYSKSLGIQIKLDEELTAQQITRTSITKNIFKSNTDWLSLSTKSLMNISSECSGATLGYLWRGDGQYNPAIGNKVLSTLNGIESAKQYTNILAKQFKTFYIAYHPPVPGSTCSNEKNATDLQEKAKNSMNTAIKTIEELNK